MVGAKWCPSVKAVTTAPANPCWPPVLPWHPQPTVVGIKRPAAIMETSPAPLIARYPSIAMVGSYPISVGIVRFKIVIHIGAPYIPKVAIFYPMSIGGKVFKKVVESIGFSVVMCVGIHPIVILTVVVKVIRAEVIALRTSTMRYGYRAGE